MGLLARIGYWLGIGIANLVNLFEPEIVVVGGGLGGTGNKLLFDPARSTFESYLFGRCYRREVPSIVSALLGADAGLIGAAAIALEEATSQAFE
jgi:glucokinase